MEVILICIAITIVTLIIASYVHRSRQRTLLTKQMDYPCIKKLYKYRPPNCYTLDILRKCCLWAAKPERFNDPFDCDLEILVGITEDNMLAAIHQNRSESTIAQYKASKLDADGKFIPEERKRLDDLTQELIEENRNMGVVCLSEVCDSILMWSHYAENHKKLF